MKVYTEQRIFWFFKKGVKLDLSNKSDLDLYVQQIISRGRFSDVKKLLLSIPLTDFIGSFRRIENFLPREVKSFWEGGFEYLNRSAKKDPHLV
ncbi:MAG: hypothetical protein ABIK20_01460 [Candidatus Omnitrophota bacterium]